MITSYFLDEELKKLAQGKQTKVSAEYVLSHAADLLSTYRRAADQAVKGAGKHAVVEVTFSVRSGDRGPKQPERRNDSLRFLRTLWKLEDSRPDKEA